MPSPNATDLRKGVVRIFNSQDLLHLSIAVHFNDEDLIVLVDEFRHLVGEGKARTRRKSALMPC